jgi:nicotinamidase-related amidase
VDYQAEFTSGALPLEGIAAAVSHAAELLTWARAVGLHIVHVRQAGKPGGLVFAPGSAGAAGLPELRPEAGETVIEKTAGGAFTHTDLADRLRARGVDTLIVAGLMTHLAVDVTVRDAAVAGLTVLIAADACATRSLPGAAGAPAVPAATLHAASLAALADRFADVRSTAELARGPVDR